VQRVGRVGGELTLHLRPASLGELRRERPLPVAEDDDRQVAEATRAAKPAKTRGELEPRSSILEDAARRGRSGLARRVDEYECRDLRAVPSCVEQRVETPGGVAHENHRALEVRRSNKRVLVRDVPLQASAETGPRIAATDTRAVERAEADVPDPLPHIGPSLRRDRQPGVGERDGPAARAPEPELSLSRGLDLLPERARPMAAAAPAERRDHKGGGGCPARPVHDQAAARASSSSGPYRSSFAGPTPGTEASSAIVLGRREAISASVELWKTT